MSTAGTQITLLDLNEVDFAKGDGLLPAVVQHAGSGTVLMLGYMNREALLATLTRRRVVFFSRSKDRLWEKGETSGHRLNVEAIRTDCDAAVSSAVIPPLDCITKSFAVADLERRARRLSR